MELRQSGQTVATPGPESAAVNTGAESSRTGRMLALLALLRNARFVRYFVASVVSLAFDSGSFLILLRLEVPGGLAAFLGYSIGMVVNWLLLSRAVFGDSLAERGPARTQQKALFVISTLLGLGLTTGIVSIAAAAGFNLVITKGIAVVVSFTANWLVRKHFVFKSLESVA
jgi:putative flippase GtrA